MLEILSIVVLILCFWILISQLIRREEAISRRRSIAIDRHYPHAYKRIPRDPEEKYIEGIGYIIGDVSCKYNARSPYMRCAVNPSGLCEGCRDYYSQ